jgi:hypothetical protein
MAGLEQALRHRRTHAADPDPAYAFCGGHQELLFQERLGLISRRTSQYRCLIGNSSAGNSEIGITVRTDFGVKSNL